MNLGRPEETTIAVLAETILRVCGAGSGTVHLEQGEDDPLRRKPDISRASALLEWTPGVPLEEGIEITVAWFRELLKTVPGDRIDVARP